MEREEVISKLKPIVCAAFNVENIELKDDMSAENVEQWTSLSFMMLLTEIENQFGFKFKMMEMLRLKTMGSIINAIQTHLS